MQHRIEQVSDELRRAISNLLVAEIRDPDLRGVTVTRVRMTPDLKLAHVYFDCPGKAEQSQVVEAAFKKATKFIRREIGHKMQLRYVPEFYFHYDEARIILEKADAILEEIDGEEPGKHG